jgi:stringent starvation protein B
MANSEISTKPYLLRALYEWCVDNGYTPHLAVKVDSRSQVPSEYVRNGEITLNVSPSAVHKLQMGNELIEFSARFAGVARQISVPVPCVYALYARETGHGMTFDVDAAKPAIQTDAEKEAGGKVGPSNESGPALAGPVGSAPASAAPTEPTKPTGGKPQLRRIK